MGDRAAAVFLGVWMGELAYKALMVENRRYLAKAVLPSILCDDGRAARRQPSPVAGVQAHRRPGRARRCSSSRTRRSSSTWRGGWEAPAGPRRRGRPRLLGLLGLIGAIERFEPDRDIKFETYAIARIKGSIIDELRPRTGAALRPRPRP